MGHLTEVQETCTSCLHKCLQCDVDQITFINTSTVNLFHLINNILHFYKCTKRDKNDLSYLLCKKKRSQYLIIVKGKVTKCRRGPEVTYMYMKCSYLYVYIPTVYAYLFLLFNIHIYTHTHI